MIDHTILLRSGRLILQQLCLLLALASLPLSAQATIFKCVDANGNTTYTGSPCAIDESAQRISKSATAVSGQDCRVARTFSQAISKRLKQGESSASVFESFGGINSLTPATIGLISYIYTFQGNDRASASRIATLAADRCEIGTFGPAASRCDAYPHEFIQAAGGCNAAHDGVKVHEPTLGAASPANSKQYSPPGNNDAQRAYSATAAKSAREECRQRIAENIANTVRSMNESLPARTMELLRMRHRNLRTQLNHC